MRFAILIFDLLMHEGLCMGGSTGINVAGAIKLAKELGRGKTIVTVLCDYGTRYQSKLFDPAFVIIGGSIGLAPGFLARLRAMLAGAGEVTVDQLPRLESRIGDPIGGADVAVQERLATEELLELDGLGLDRPPGERRVYSNLGFQLLGPLIEEVAGVLYIALVITRLVGLGRPQHATGRALGADGVTPCGRAVPGVPGFVRCRAEGRCR